MVVIIICFTATPTFALYYSSKNVTINLNDSDWTRLSASDISVPLDENIYAIFYNDPCEVYVFFSYETITTSLINVDDIAEMAGVSTSEVSTNFYNGRKYFVVEGPTYPNIAIACTVDNDYMYAFYFTPAEKILMSGFLSRVNISSPTTTTQSTQSSYQGNATTTKNSYSDISSKQTSEIRGMLLVVTVAVVLSLIYYMLGKKSKNKTKDKFGLVSFLIPLFTSFAVYLVSYFLLYHFTTSEYYNIVALAIGLCLFFLLRAGLRSLWEKSKDDTQPQSSAEAEKKSKRKIGAISFLISFAVYLAISFCLYHFTEYIYKITPYAIGLCLFFSLRTYLQGLQKKPENIAQPQNTTVSQINNDENKT